MLLFMRKKTEAEAADTPQGTGHAAPHDFVPCHSHFGPHTLLTKNGELMQVIRIGANAQGLNYETGDETPDHPTIRQAVRDAIAGSLNSDKLALWIHTVRKRKPVRFRAQYKEPFAAYTHDQWQKKHRWKYQYHNEVYITVLHDGQPAPMADKAHINHIFMTRANRQFRNAYLDQAHAELNATVENMMGAIAPHYQVNRLGIAERLPPELNLPQPIFYSEPMEFLGMLVNLRDEAWPLPEADVSKALTDPYRLTFGFNALECKDHAGKRRFAAMLSLKQYREVPAETADTVLQAPMEFIISQSFRFIPHTEALKPYKEQKRLFEVSGDTQSIEATGILDMLRSNQGRPTDFGEYQTSIMVLSDDFKQIDAETSKVQSTFAELGLITIREDIRLEECFWAQLPGNFEFLRRRTAINTMRVGGFARLNRFPGGNDHGNHWGEALALLPTMVGSPYFFNMHYQDNGHTLMFDFNSFNDHAGTILTNFLVTEARKYGGRLYLFDRDRSAQLLFDKLGGHYHTFAEHRQPGLQLNPFALPDDARNHSFLLAWCAALISPEQPLEDAKKETLKAAIAQLYTQPEEQRHLAAFADMLSAMDASLADALRPWFGHGRLAGLVDAPGETLDRAQPMHAFDMTAIAQRPAAIVPVLSYLLHRIIIELDGRPTIIVLHEALELLENRFFAPRLESLLEMLKQNNALVLLTAKRPAEAAASQILPVLMQQCATHLYVPDDVEIPYAAEALGLTENDAQLLLRLERQKGDFLIKQGGETVALRAHLKEIDDLYAIFDNNIKNLAAAGGSFAGTGKRGKP